MWYFGILYAVGNMILSGIAAVIYKSQTDKIKPIAMVLIQTLTSAISFLILTAIMGDFLDMFRIPWMAFLPLLSAAIMGIIIGNFMYLTSLQYVGLTITYPIAMTYPLLTYIYEIIIFDAVFDWLKFLGIILIIGGVVMISFSQVNEDTPEKNVLPNTKSISDVDDTSESILLNSKTEQSEPKILEETEKSEKAGRKFSQLLANKKILGIILALLATVTWATGTTLIKVGLDRTDIDIIPISGARMTLLLPITFTLFLATKKKTNHYKFSWKATSFLILGALIGLFASNIFYLKSIEILEGISIPAAIAASGPLITIPLSILFLKEKVDWKILLGTLLTIGGIVLVILNISEFLI
ncbi:MAG: DMT family transporter [Candidatus Heimdallarchaeota archaeon]|nr:DMT family transporter [Candidatus Heimdallarchaeota archaeon]